MAVILSSLFLTRRIKMETLAEVKVGVMEDEAPCHKSVKIEDLYHKDPAVRRKAAKCLYLLSDKKQMLKLIEEALHDHDETVRFAAVQSLSKQDGDQAICLLVKAFDDKDVSVRLRILQRLLHTDSRLARSTVKNARKDVNAHIRKTAFFYDGGRERFKSNGIRY